MLYARQFFKTREEAMAFKKQKGFGALYCGEPGSRTKKDYDTEAWLANLTSEKKKTHPFCVAWNVVSEDPIASNDGE